MTPRRKMPTKGELLQLQKLYKTDERIGERLGGVPAYLVAYWRRKKGVPRHSQPKFSETEVRNLWERFGDDDRCGLELGISKAAFYNWRRRYGIREKPAFLKLEQLELAFPGLKTLSRAAALYGKQTISQKILARAAGKEKVEAGELVVVGPDVVFSHNDTSHVIDLFRQLGVEQVWNPGKIVVSLNQGGERGRCEGRSEDGDHARVREFVRRQGIREFYDINQGSCHQVALERGNIVPGQMGLSTDLFTIGLGALGAFTAEIEPREMAAVWASGKTWLRVPRSLRVDISGRRPRIVGATDVTLSIIGRLGVRRAGYMAIEYYGSTVTQMSISERITLAALSSEMSAKAVLLPFESVTRRYLAGRTNLEYTAVLADKDAEYDELFQINIEKLIPQIAGPGSFEQVRPVADLDGQPVTQVIIGGGSSGRFDDIRMAAEIIKGKQVHPDCRLIVVPASRLTYLEAIKKGLIRILVEAGAVVMNPGCPIHPDLVGEPMAPHERILTTGSVGLTYRSASTGEIYVCSAATAAASALSAAVTDPIRYGR